MLSNLREAMRDAKITQRDMFAAKEIPNDLAEVDKAICEYYEIAPGKKEETK